MYLLQLFPLLVAFATPALTKNVPYIVGGQVAEIGAWPWLGAIHWMFGDLHQCGAAIVSPDFIVTAAHCVDNSPFAYHLVAGLYDNSDWSKAQPEEHHFYGVYKHPDFDGTNNDIAVIEIHSPDINMTNPYVGTIALAPAAASYEGRQCVMTGWGSTGGASSDPSPIPMEAYVSVISNEECAKSWPDLINDGHICIASGQVSTCAGDSGTPLACKNSDGQWELAGVSSFGSEGCSIDKPSVFARVSHFREWIDKEME